MKTEEVEMADVMPNRSAEELISVLHGVHCDNSRLQYYAERIDGGRPVSQMPLTPFIYEFFLFNSLYQVDWINSNEVTGLVYHSEAMNESQKQRAFISHLKQRISYKPADLYRAFEPLNCIDKAQGSWTQISPDSRITKADGDKFFRDVLKLQNILEECSTPFAIPLSNKTFDILRDCTYYIYLVRNNIFHGSKTLGEVNNSNQKRRVEIYDMFLKGITSLFFLASGKETAACDFVPCPVYTITRQSAHYEEIADQSLILGAIAKSFMKIGDTRLISRFSKVVPLDLLEAHPSNNSSLFYPSASTDFLTPLLLGLPYCTQFYFFEQHRSEKPPAIAHILKRIGGLRIPSSPPQWITNSDRHCLDFEFNGVPRRLHWIHADNTAFLQEDVALSFYFHRGDSWGEGGSGQEWDSILLPELIKKIPPNSSCIYLTDGEPGGFKGRHATEKYELHIPFIESGRTYYCGRFSHAA